MKTLTDENRAAIAALLEKCHLPSGLGRGFLDPPPGGEPHYDACSIAAINLALTGELSDDIPECMSKVIGKWIIVTQDAMPEDMRNSREWRELLPLAAGTGRDREEERLGIVMEWMWDTLALLNPLAEANGFAAEWRRMLEEKTVAASRTAVGVAEVAEVAAEVAGAAWAATWVAKVTGATWAAAWAADASARAARAAIRAGEVCPPADQFWKSADPVALLSKLIHLPETP